MNKLLILCVDDERDVLDSVVRDLQQFSTFCDIEAAESVAEAREVIADYHSEHVPLAMILCDHIMPKETGVNFLIELHDTPATKSSKKILLTGQADLNDTVNAINHHCLDFYIAKPWQKETLVDVVTAHLTRYVLDTQSNPMQWAKFLDTAKILQEMSEKRLQFGE
ncbi:response regulator [Vibrio ezurae]|uniref:Putative two-component response regulator n=1 Tax=Vibrio ezurae NBRC 102218 TaxID=1219080 RepID=U3AGT7_9VIBR|nr:response regulator [Vibrio ezurae]GAD79141.1 putative two-component response regulator [Vibrio ezurae NBRC 102218]